MGEMPHLPQNKNRKKTRKNSPNHGKRARSDLPSLVANLQQIFSFLQFLQKQLHAEKKNYSKSKLSTPVLFTFFCYTPKNKPSLIYVIIFNPFKTLEFINSNNLLKTKFY